MKSISIKKVILVLVILALASVFVFTGTNFSQPFLEHPDENTVVEYAEKLALSGTNDPDTYLRPNHVSIYTHSYAYRLVNTLMFETPLDVTFAQNTVFFYHLSRDIIALQFVLLVFVIFLIGREYSYRTGILAMLVAALTLLLVENAHYVTPDIPLTLFSALVILFSVKYIKSEKLIYIALMIFFCAVAVAEKYPGLILVSIPFFSVLYINWKTSKWFFIIGVASAISFIVFLFVISPHLFISWRDVGGALHHETRASHPGADGLGYFGNIWFYIKSWLSDMGVVTLPLIGFGLYQIVKKRTTYIYPIFFGWLFCILMSILVLHWPRWALPMYLTPIVLFAIGLDELFKLIKNKKILSKVIYVVTAFVFLTYLVGNIALIIDFRLPTTMIEADKFVKENNINRENTAYDGYNPFIVAVPKKTDYNFMLKENIDMKYQYIMLSSGMNSRYFLEPERYQDIIQNIESIRRDNELIFKAEPFRVATIDNTYYLKSIDFINDVKWIYGVINADAPKRGYLIEIYRVMKDGP